MSSVTERREGLAFGEALVADGPAEEYADALVLHGQSVDEWDFE